MMVLSSGGGGSGGGAREGQRREVRVVGRIRTAAPAGKNEGGVANAITRGRAPRDIGLRADYCSRGW